MSQRQEYVKGVVERAREEWPDEETVEEKWRAMRTALVDTAGETLGKAKRSQPDWFLDAENTIRPFLQARNAAYTKWLATGDRQELVKFREARGRKGKVWGEGSVAVHKRLTAWMERQNAYQSCCC